MSSGHFGSTTEYLNGSGFTQPRDAGSDFDRVGNDERMEQVRELILGDMRRQWESRMQTLETRLQVLEDKIDALRHEARLDQQQSIAALAAGIEDLGRHVRRLTTT